jgi:hypothetical protein
MNALTDDDLSKVQLKEDDEGMDLPRSVRHSRLGVCTCAATRRSRRSRHQSHCYF